MSYSPHFFVAQYESGRTQDKLPLWASHIENPVELSQNSSSLVECKDVAAVPGAFQLLNVLSTQECQNLIRIAEGLGFTQDAAVSLARNVRHNTNMNWLIDDTTQGVIWSRVSQHLNRERPNFLGREPLGINQRCRFYKYEKGDYFSFHTDGAWPGSRMVKDEPVVDAFGDRFSLYTFLIFLSDDFAGGETLFKVKNQQIGNNGKRLTKPNIEGVKTPAGGVLCFPHGSHPLHCLHGSRVITSGTKYIVRTDMLFSL